MVKFMLSSLEDDINSEMTRTWRDRETCTPAKVIEAPMTKNQTSLSKTFLPVTTYLKPWTVVSLRNRTR